MMFNRVCLHRLLSLLGTIAVITAGSPHSIAGPPVLIDLGVDAFHVDSFDPIPFSFAISADGSTAVGGTASGRAFRWRSATGAVDLGDLPGSTTYGAVSVNADGSVIAGHFDTPGVSSGVFRWTEGAGMQNIGIPPVQGFGSLYPGPMSADGSVLMTTAVFDGMASSILWTADAGFASAPLVNDGPILSIMNGDATVFATSGVESAYLWTEDSGYEDIGGITLGGLPASVTAPTSMAADASAVVGYSERSAFNQRAWRWTPDTGMQNLGTPGLDYGSSIALGVSADGDRVVGTARDALSRPIATLWTPGLGMVDLNDYLPTLGVDLTGWDLMSASAISADGTVIGGVGTLDGRDVYWVISGIPAPGTLAALGAFSLLTSRRRRPTRTLTQERSSS